MSTKFISVVIIKKQNYREAISGWLAVSVLEKHHCIFDGSDVLDKNFSTLVQDETFMFPYEKQAEHLQHSTTLIFQRTENIWKMNSSGR